MAKAVVVLSPPQAFPEAFLHFCHLRLQVSEPILHFSHSSLKGCIKVLSSLLHSKAVVQHSSLAASSASLREVASQQREDCVFLLCDEEMEQLCALEGALKGTLGLQFSPNPGMDWALTREDFQAYLHSKMTESWRGETPPKMNLQMHLAVMREAILTTLREELKATPCDYAVLFARLQDPITATVHHFAKEIEDNQNFRLEEMMGTAVKWMEEAREQFEKAAMRAETQISSLLQEQSGLVRLLNEANEALGQAKLLKDKLASYEETNKTTQELIYSLTQARSHLGVAQMPAKPLISESITPPKPGNSQQAETSSASLHEFTPPAKEPASLPVRPTSNEPPPVSKAHSVEIPRGKPDFKPRTTAPKPTALSSSSVVILEIDEGSESQDCLVVKVRNTLEVAIEGANLVVFGSPPRLVFKEIPPLPPGMSQFLVPADCLPEDLSDHVDFYLGKDNSPISLNYPVDLGQAEVPCAPVAKPSSFPAKPSSDAASLRTSALSEASIKKEMPGLTPDQSLKFKATMAQLGGSAELNTQEKIKKLLQDPATASLQPEQLLEKIFS